MSVRACVCVCVYVCACVHSCVRACECESSDSGHLCPESLVVTVVCGSVCVCA